MKHTSKYPVYYNENNAYCVQWLRNLIAAGHLPQGDVDDRSITSVHPQDLKSYTQCHFFSGIGGWPYALSLAGFPHDRPVWTGSCPCQPFSVAGKRAGMDDERHLWPAWLHLIRECQPAAIFGEQVASVDGLAWLDLVQTDMEGEGYAFAAFDICAAGIGSPHLRQRFYFTAERQGSVGSEREQTGKLGDTKNYDGRLSAGNRRSITESQWAGKASKLEFPGGQRRQWGQTAAPGNHSSRQASDGPQSEYGSGFPSAHRLSQNTPHPTNSFWRAADWLLCRDAKFRAVEPGTFPLADGVPSRVGRLRAYGNAIVPQLAAEVIKAFLSVRP